MAAGREMHLRSLQPFAPQVANSLSLGDYLTSEGQEAEADLAMISDAGFGVLSASRENVGANLTIRRRGAGTAMAPNA